MSYVKSEKKLGGIDVNRVDYTKELANLIKIQKTAQHVHPIYCSYFPVVIVLENTFYIYDISYNNSNYQFIKSEPSQFSIPVGVRAAFPLECYENKTCAIVTSDVFDNEESYVDILHEFVHCAQAKDCEAELKGKLTISKMYNEKNDCMWEINHQFSYSSKSFHDLFSQYLDALSQCNYSYVKDIRRQFKGMLDKHDVEYLLWQEWKEGFARFLENKLRDKLGLDENHYGNQSPYNRISFYESGSQLISLIERVEPSITGNLKDLFFQMEKDIFSDFT